MERVELALKNSVAGGDDFSVDDLLDFSNDDVFVEDEAELKVQRKRGDGDNTLRRSNDISTAGEEFGSLPTSELAVPMDDLKELEWLSNFVDDSLTPYSAPTKKPVWLTGNRRHPVASGKEESCFKTLPPVQIRSKRPRTGTSALSSGSPTLTDSSSSSTTSSPSSSAPSNPPWLSGAELINYPQVKRQKEMRPSLVISSNTKSQTQRCSNCGFQKPPQWRAGPLGANRLCNACPLYKRQKMMRASLVNSSNTESQTRRCSHCGVQKTPQWRAGPMGAKTLCNACGVRFKSGRLLPEYRPACSPTFSSELHSNHHRKVIEMRRKKETTDSDETGLNPSVQAVPTF